MSKRSHPTLAEVQSAFVRWRTERSTRRTPLELRAQAVGLLAQHSVTEVMKALQVDHRRLSRWRRELSAPSVASTSSGFVELPSVAVEKPLEAVVPTSVALTLTRHASDGSAVSVVGQLSAVQWRWALGLLAESGS